MRGWRPSPRASARSSKSLRDALIEDRAVVAARLVAERRGQPALADAGRAAEHQIVVGVDPFALGQLLEQGAVETARGAIVDVFDAGLLAQFGDAQPRREALVVSHDASRSSRSAEPFGMGEASASPPAAMFGEGLGHAMQAKGVKLVEGWMFEQVVSP